MTYPRMWAARPGVRCQVRKGVPGGFATAVTFHGRFALLEP